MCHLHCYCFLTWHLPNKKCSVYAAILCLLLLIFLVAAITYIWKTRYFYYYTLKFPGSIFNIFYLYKVLLTTNRNLLKRICRFCQLQPTIFKIWAPNCLFIVNSEPEDLEILLNTFLDKSSLYKFFEKFIGKTITSLPVKIWKERRRESSRSFNNKIIVSFHDNFVKYAKKIVENFDDKCGEEQTDLLPVISKCNLDNSFENIGDMDPVLVENRYIAFEYIIIGQKMITECFRTIWLLVDFIFRYSRFQKEIDKMMENTEIFKKRVFETKNEQMKFEFASSDLRSKRFANQIFNLYTSDKITKTEMMDEIDFMLMAAVDTTTKTLVFAILVLGIHEEVQKKIYEEISSVTDEDLRVEDIDRMDYLDRFVKETLRLFPIIPIVLRTIDKNYQLGSLTYPAGSHLVVPIDYIHKRPDLWPDPLKFDPDRFLPEEVAKRHRCAYIPFSSGPRNCIGFTYGLLSMKVNIAFIVKQFKIKTLNCQKVEDLKVNWYIISEAADYSVIFERRTNSK